MPVSLYRIKDFLTVVIISRHRLFVNRFFIFFSRNGRKKADPARKPAKTAFVMALFCADYDLKRSGLENKPGRFGDLIYVYVVVQVCRAALAEAAGVGIVFSRIYGAVLRREGEGEGRFMVDPA